MFRISIILLFIVLQSSCQLREGCTDPGANNYDAKAETDDNSCRYDDELFRGRWRVRDSVWVDSIYVADTQKSLDITTINNKSTFRLVLSHPGGLFSDTLNATLVPLALSIPRQEATGGFFKGSIIYMFYAAPAEDKLRIDYVRENEQGIITAYRGIAERLP